MTPDETALLERDLPSNLMYIPYYRWFASYLLHRDVSLDEMYARAPGTMSNAR
jgi:hypothetical protein